LPTKRVNTKKPLQAKTHRNQEAVADQNASKPRSRCRQNVSKPRSRCRQKCIETKKPLPTKRINTLKALHAKRTNNLRLLRGIRRFIRGCWGAVGT
jgi:hypothetical protein